MAGSIFSSGVVSGRRLTEDSFPTACSPRSGSECLNRDDPKNPVLAGRAQWQVRHLLQRRGVRRFYGSLCLGSWWTGQRESLYPVPSLSAPPLRPLYTCVQGTATCVCIRDVYFHAPPLPSSLPHTYKMECLGAAPVVHQPWGCTKSRLDRPHLESQPSRSLSALSASNCLQCNVHARTACERADARALRFTRATHR